MMEETSSDEQPEIVTREEVEEAEKEATKSRAESKTSGFSNLPSPSPLPSIMTSPTSQIPSSGVTSLSTISTPTVGGVLSHAPNVLKSEPAPQQSPHVPRSEPTEPVPAIGSSHTPPSGGLLSWISGNSLVSKVVEKTKSSVESVITTLDPGMKEVIRSGGDIDIVVTSNKENKVGAVREAFQSVFGRASIRGEESDSSTAAQPVGYTAGLKGSEERILNLRRNNTISDEQVVVSIEGFIVELLPDKWFEMSCIVLQDPIKKVQLQTFSQPTPVPTEYVLTAQDQTPADYPLRWAGLSVSIGSVIEGANPHIGHVDWQKALTGVGRRESLTLALTGLAYLYLQKLPSSMIS